MGTAITLVKETFTNWNEDKAPRLAAALAYYMIFSMAPLLTIIIAVAGLVFGAEAASGQLFGQISGMVGPEAAVAIQAAVEGASQPRASIIATVIGVVTLLFGAAGVFGALQESLNTIWEVTPKPNQGFMAMIKTRFLSLTMVFGVAFLLLVSLVISAMLSGVVAMLQGMLPLPGWSILVIDNLLSFLVATILFALIFKVLPDVEISFRDVWIGAAATAALFTLGKYLIGLYLGQTAAGSSYGAAGSLIVLLLWIYYSAQILFLGAEFTQVYAKRHGTKIEPSSHAMSLTTEAKLQQGIVPEEEKRPQVYTPRPTPVVQGSSTEVSSATRIISMIIFTVGVLIAGIVGKRKTA